jgi:tripartite ATP-independent transporter DctP family solute receptor
MIMRRRNFMRASGFVLAAAVSLALTGPGQAAEVTLRLGLSSFNTHPYNLAAERYRKKVEELSKGAIAIKVFPNRQLGGVKELTEGVRFGTVDMTINSSSAMADLIPAIDALQLPFLINSYSDLAALATTPEAEALSADLGKKGAIALAIYEGGQRHFATVKHEVKTINDFKGLKTRVAPVRLHLDIWRALGANPTPMGYGEVYTALETGTIDAVETNISSILNEKYSEVTKHVLLDGHYFWPGLLMINKARYDKLKPEYQEILRKAAKETVKPQMLELDEYDRNAMEELKKKGVHFTTASPELLAQMRKAVEPVYEEYLKKFPKMKPFVEAAKRLQSSAKSN